MTAALFRRALVPVLVLSAFACESKFKGGGDLRAQKVVLKREVDGLREAVARLEKGQPILPIDDVAIAIDDTLVRDLIAAQLPFEMDVDRFHVSLTEAEARFRGSPVVRLRGALNLKERPDLAAVVNVIGALEEHRRRPGQRHPEGPDRRRPHRDREGGRHRAAAERRDDGRGGPDGPPPDQGPLPPIQIPVKVQQSIDLPAVTTGPVRIDGATMPLQVAVSQVLAGQGLLWISVHFQPGDLVKTADAPEVGDASAAEAGVSLGIDDEAGAGRPAIKGKGK